MMFYMGFLRGYSSVRSVKNTLFFKCENVQNPDRDGVLQGNFEGLIFSPKSDNQSSDFLFVLVLKKPAEF